MGTYKFTLNINCKQVFSADGIFGKVQFTRFLWSKSSGAPLDQLSGRPDLTRRLNSPDMLR